MSTIEITEQRWTNAARVLGRRHALNAASWTVDGNTDHNAIAFVVARMDEGDDVSDYLPACPNLSGEWADDLTPVRLYEEITGNDHAATEADAGMGYETLVGSIMDALCAAYEEGVAETFETECERVLRAAL